MSAAATFNLAMFVNVAHTASIQSGDGAMTTTTLRAYSHPKISRDAFLAELQAHQNADRILQGTYWSKQDDGQFRGCAVGCGIESIIRRTGDKLKHDDHAAYETYLGVPHIMARLEDRIFEGLPTDVALKWPLRFASAIKSGADLSQVWNKFAPWMLREISLPSVRGDLDQARAVIERVARGYETGWQNDTPREARLAADAADSDAAAYAAAAAAAADAAAAAAAADAAAEAAADADAADSDAAAADADAADSDAAAYAAAAADAADSDAAAYAAAAADADAADAADADAADAARKQAFIRMADKLVELMEAAPVPELEPVQ